jgi:hypothetical protein
MNTKIKVIAVSIAVLLLAILLVSTVLAEGLTPTSTPVPQTPFGRWSGMMGRGGAGIGPTTGITGTMPYGYGPGGCPMYGGGGWGYPGTSTPISMDQAIQAASQYVAAYGNSDLTLTEVMEFTNNFYAEVAEKSTGIHAFELLINRYTGAVSPEPGPNMMWNTKYGHMGGLIGGMMGGMMGGRWGQPGGAMTVTPEQAKQKAQQWLNTYLPGTAVAEDADPFYGYYTIHVLKDGQVYGMLSVNGYTGQVWYHTWHGDFIGLQELAS